MADELVLDASVAAKCFFTEDGSVGARALVSSGVRLIAPDLIFAEVASVAAKRFRRGDIPFDLAARAVESIPDLVDETTSLRVLAPHGFELAQQHGFSAYDACYLALAEQRNTKVVTADRRLIDKAALAGLAALVRPLS
jgi:predicted nucleic acid-binding protein